MRAGALSVAALAAALPALGLPLAARAEGGTIRGGEHTGFTRIVLEVEPTTEWSLETVDGRATLHFPGRRISFSTAGVFDKIPHIRITDIDAETGHDGTTVALSIGCDCRISTSFVGARFLAVDVADRTTPELAATEPAEAEAAPADASASDKARALRESHVVADAENALVRQIARAADQGIVRFTDGAGPTPAPEMTAGSEPTPTRPLPRPSVEMTADAASADQKLTRTALHPPAADGATTLADLMAQDQISASTVFDRDSQRAQARPPIKPLPGACLADRALDPTAWSDGTPFPEELGHLRSHLVGEFDTPDPAVIRDTARLYIRLGLGAEAEATLGAFPDAKVPDRAVLLDLARVVDDRPVTPRGPLAVDAECPGLHGVWLAAGGAVPVWRSAAGFEAVHAAFAEMPGELRTMLAPTLVRRLIDAGRISEARTIYLTAVRPGDPTSPALQLAEARLEAAEGRSAEAVRTMAKLARSNQASISIDALADLVRVALDTHLAIPEPVATDLATATLQSRGSAFDGRLRGLLAETLAQRGDLPGALAELRRGMSDLPAQADTFAELAVRLVAEADPAMIGSAVYAEAALGTQDLIAATSPADPVRARIASRLVDLGLPDPALAIAAPALAAGDEAARMVSARAEIARGDGAAARAALGPLASTAAIELRAQAFARSGDYAEAAATLDAAGLDATADGYAWASGDWAKAGEAAPDADRAAMARYMAARAGDTPPPQPDAAGADAAALDADAAFAEPLPSLERPSLGAARQLLATGGKIGGVVEGALAKP
ncbi:MAG: hypothetical protein QM699_13210 [Amaricoccus sp.]|uniref:tetratricopeptide repeat protein n=1 Tax=Amaricoccus sp. TaxID=1872485 RepID=UPI0039E36E56